MPRTTTDFSPIDQGEQKNLTYGFGVPGQPTSPLAIGESIASVIFQISMFSGIDPNPVASLMGPGAVQPGGLAVTQSVAPQVGGAIYKIKAFVVTTGIPPQKLTPWSLIPCNA